MTRIRRRGAADAPPPQPSNHHEAGQQQYNAVTDADVTGDDPLIAEAAAERQQRRAERRACRSRQRAELNRARQHGLRARLAQRQRRLRGGNQVNPRLSAGLAYAEHCDPDVTDDDLLSPEVREFLAGLRRRREAALRLPPLRCGRRDPWCQRRGTS